MVNRFFGSGQCAILIDSGAFSAHRLGEKIRLTTYIEACKEYLSYDDVWGCIQLDVIGNKERSRANLHRMVSAGVRPMPVLTVDAPLEWAKEYADINPRMCVAGALGAFEGCQEWIEERYHKVKEVAPQSELHGLGYVRWPQMFTVPLASVDSSSHSAGERYGILAKFNRQTGMKFLGRRVVHYANGWKNMDAEFKDYLDKCRVTRRDWFDEGLINSGPGSFAACSMTATSAQQSIYGKRHDRAIFQAGSNWLCWARMMLVIKHGADDASFDFWRVRKELLALRAMPVEKRNDAILETMREINANASARLPVG
jgi:hypothetical protein